MGLLGAVSGASERETTVGSHRHEVGTARAQREGILMARCRAKNAEGKPCRAPEGMVDPITRYCPAHRPGATERFREAGRKGAKVSTRLRLEAVPVGNNPRSC